MGFAWGAAGRPILGESASGDAYLVREVQGGLLMAVVDGLGHGAEAAIASAAVIRALEQHADLPLAALVEACHVAVRDTRGAVLSVAVASASSGRMTWLGIGNVEALVARVEAGRVRRREHLLLRNGVVGMMLPRLQTSEQKLEPGDLVIMATDGIRRGFQDELDPRGEPGQIAARILDAHGRENDDALVLVVRFRGAPA